VKIKKIKRKLGRTNLQRSVLEDDWWKDNDGEDNEGGTGMFG